MSILKVFSNIFRGVNPVKEVVGNLDKLILNDEELLALTLEETRARLNLEKELIKAARKIDSSISAVNLQNAKSSNFFVAGWRPALGWLFVTIFIYKFLIHPLFNSFLPMVEIDATEILPILIGILGLGGMRSFEKHKRSSNVN